MTQPQSSDRAQEIARLLDKREWYALSSGEMQNIAEELYDMLIEERKRSAKWKMLAQDAGVVE